MPKGAPRLKHKKAPLPRSKARRPFVSTKGHKKVLWFTCEGYVDNRIKYISRRYGKIKGAHVNDIQFASVHKAVKGCWVLKKNSRKVKETPKHRVSALLEYIQKVIHEVNPHVIVINDICVAKALFPELVVKDKLETYRGSKLTLPQYPDMCFIFIDDALKCYRPMDSERINEDTYAWIFVQDLRKIARHAALEPRDERPLEYTLVESMKDAEEMVAFLSASPCVSFDLETSGQYVTCISLVGYNPAGSRVCGWTVPFCAGYNDDGLYWDSIDTEIKLWLMIKELLQNTDSVKIAQNGIYDMMYLFKYGISVRNFILDTQLLMHSFCGTLPKGLGFLASLYVENYYYWKDEIKGDGSAQADKGTSVPLTRRGCEIYWEYCAKDSYNTLYVAIRLLPLIAGTPWALNNYMTTIRLQHGPLAQCALQGFRMSEERRLAMAADLTRQRDNAYQRLSVAAQSPNLNPNSSQQLSKLFFDILRVKPFKGARKTTQEKPLRRMCFRNPLGGVLLRYLTDYKKPVKLLEDLNARVWKKRFMYSLNAAGTWTGRASSSKHQYWVGKNVQNISKKLRPCLVADENVWIVPIDFSQSDGFFVAFESQDETYIDKMYQNMNDGYDTHSYHVELLLGAPYDEVVAGKRAKDPKVVDPVTGSRQIIKRVVHGKNYDMKENTMLTTVGVASIISAAKSVGWGEAHMWGDEKLKRFTLYLGTKYDKNYPQMTQWKTDLLKETFDNGNVIYAYGGRAHLVMGNPMRDTTGRIKRQASAFKGQGGTAGNINRSLLEVYYDKHVVPKTANDAKLKALGKPHDVVKSYLHEQGVSIYAQIHDEIVFGVPFGKEYLIDNLLSIMEKEITLNGRKFFVPCEAEMGLSFGNLIDYEGFDEEKSSDYYLEKARTKERDYDLTLKTKGIKL